VELTASAGGKEGKIKIPLPGFTVSYLAASATPTSIPADNKSTATIRATIFDNTGSSAFVPDGITVSFTTDGGTLEPVVAKTVNGVATTTLTSDKNPRLVTVTAQSGTSKDVAYVRFEEVGLSVNQVADIEITVSNAIIEADGTSSSQITARLLKFNGDPIETPTTVKFTTDIGEITQFVRSDTSGMAVARYTSGVVGTARIGVEVGNVTNYTNIIVVPGKPQSIQLDFNKTTVGVQGSGKNETLLIHANVKDNKNNPVADGVRVKFEIVGAHDNAVSLTPSGATQFVSSPVSTVNGTATVSFHSGTRAGAHRVKATVVDSLGTVITPAISSETTQFMVVSGPAFLDTSDMNDPFTNSHMTVSGWPRIIFAEALNTDVSRTTVSVIVADRYSNPVPEGTAVYFSSTGGVIDTKTGFTDSKGIATVTLYAGNPFPTVTNSSQIENPNASLGGPAKFTVPLLDYDGDGQKNNGIATITAYTQGIDQQGRQVTVWNHIPIVFTKWITTFTVEPAKTSLLNGQATDITITVHDVNKNPVVPGTELSISSELGALSTTKITTDDLGQIKYTFQLMNNLDPLNDTPGNTVVTVKLKNKNHELQVSTVPIYMSLSSN